MNVGHLIDPAVDAVPDRTALVAEEESTSYRGLESLVRRAASALVSAGVGPGDTVALVDLAGALPVATILAAARLGAATAQMNAYLTPGELRQLVALVGARVGVAGAAFTERLAEAVDGPVLGWTDIAGADESTRPAVGEREDTALVLFTSGTTGLPKPVRISHGVVSDRLAYWTRPVDPAADQVVDMMSAPIFHIGGTLGLFVSLHQGKQLVLLPKFDAGTWLELVERHRVTQTFVVPTMLVRILDHPRFVDTDLGSLRSLSYGAAPASADLVRRALAELPGVEFANTFGQTETLGAYASLTPEDHRRGDRFGSVGRPLAGVELRIVDPASGAPVDRGEPGEFWVRAAENTTDDWLATGDTGWQDARFHLDSLSFRPWGFRSLQISREGLAAGSLGISSASGIFPDGLLFDIPGSDSAPPPKLLAECFEPDQTTLDVYLSVPQYRERGLNVATTGRQGSARYRAEIELFRDENTGLSEKPVQIARKNLRLLAEGESLDGFSSLRVARVLRTAAGTFQADPRFVPPLLNFHASDYLAGIARQLVEILTARSGAIAGLRRQKNQSLADFTAADIANFWLLYTVNSALPAVPPPVRNARRTSGGTVLRHAVAGRFADHLLGQGASSRPARLRPRQPGRLLLRTR